MRRSEVATLLGLAAARDRRTVGDIDVAAWAQDLAGITFDEAREALGRHYRDSTAWLMPAHIREHVKAMREEARRREPHPVRELPSRWEPDDARAERVKRGIELCAAILGQRAAARPGADEPDPYDPVRNRALLRARSERRGARFGVPPNERQP